MDVFLSLTHIMEDLIINEEIDVYVRTFYKFGKQKYVCLYTLISTHSQRESDTCLVPHPREGLGLGQGYITIYRHSHLSGVVCKPAPTSARHMYRRNVQNILQI